MRSLSFLSPLLLLTVAHTVDGRRRRPGRRSARFPGLFLQKFPNVKPDDFANGPYALNEDMRRQWEEKEQFPPYEFSLEAGKELFAKPFANGKHYADCFPDHGVGIRQNYPQFDAKSGKVITLELALNQCREANGERPSPIPATTWPR